MMGLMTNTAAPYIPFGNPYFMDAGNTSEGNIIASRFGDIRVDAEETLTFPRGLLGFPQCARFVLTEFPSEKMRKFKLLQSLDELQLSFITLPLELHNNYIAQEDVMEGCKALAIDPRNLQLALILTVKRTAEGTRITGNSRAPLFIDTSRRFGLQYVFQSSRYPVQCEIA